MSLPIKYNVCFLLLLYVNQGFAQDSTRFLIKADQLIAEVLTPERIYQQPTFPLGKIIFKDKTVTEAPLSYNYLNGEIEFINPAHDTMAIAKHQMLNIERVLLNKDTFYYDNGYLQQILQTPVGVLAKRRILTVFKREKIGAYGRPEANTSIESMEYFTDRYGSITRNLKVNENITMVYRDQYFFGDNFHSFAPANKKNLLKLYPSRKAVLNDYLKGNNVNFRSNKDLQNLFLLLK